MSEELMKTPCAFGENGNFLLERELGSGGMGGVYMGRDKMLDRPVAVKVMLREYGSDADFVGKFKKEAQSAARLIHPNIAQIYSYGICDGMPYIAMELASGGSLYSIMNAAPGKTDVARILKICQQTAQALQCASDQGCVHGDVKPENILLDANGNAKLVDFGLAAMQKDTSEIWGTPYYISPEKVKKEEVDFRADMYSLGATLYHALTGVAPFEGEDAVAVVRKRFDGMPKKPSEIRPEITPAIDALVMKMLAVDKADRFPSFEALLQEFTNVLTTGLTAGKPIVPSRPVAPGATMRPLAMRRLGGRPMMRARRPLKAAAPAAPPPEENDDDEEESGGNLGLKVAGIVVGVILLVAAIAGGLVWYQVSAKKAQEAELQAQIAGQTEKALAAIADTTLKARRFADEVDEIAGRAEKECGNFQAELVKLLPPEQKAFLKPEPSKELLDAIASTNPAVAAAQAPAAEAATNAAPAAATNAAPAAATSAAPAAAAAPATNAAPAEAAVQPCQAAIDMIDLWNRAYGCRASAIRIRSQIAAVVEKSAAAEAYRTPSRDNAENLAAISRTIVELFEQVKVSKDVENVRKAVNFIKSKGEKTLKSTVARLRREKFDAEQKAKKEAQESRRKAQQEEKERLQKELVENEVKAAGDKFDTIAAQGSFRLNDWKSALRQLEALKSDFKTAEGQLAADLQIAKVNAMSQMFAVLVKNMPGKKDIPPMAFKKGKLRGAKVVSVNDRDLILEADKKRRKVSWQKFVKDNYVNFIEAIGQYVFKGRRNAGLNQREVAAALSGGALYLKIVCGETQETAVQRSVELAKQAVKEFPEYAKTAKEMFPDVAFEEAE